MAFAVLVGMFVSLAVLVVRNILVYVVAAYGAIAVALSIEESLRGYGRQLVQSVLALAFGPSVMVFSLALCELQISSAWSRRQ